ncbi:hypothetical protein PUNSTDRAFT_144721 [Punctularia strigosozonata HHB-11173 SS5]|uniref:uncharacterized protein n=1 Tax=Punctularia strigosozonata (strain HHB-11173) TaxID=741275 RepID=UPI00044169CA|nr:uncharacterized protein PUNSTDRAFT_144721 [Punctularia strigosozonata HHB-11173 SS5]EIN07190.1 hypothetical protein PUNSTDRAFT_144721 [Punctularia strigosozonata HHB-11173 SS5]
MEGNEPSTSSRSTPSLVQYCQRALALHIEAITDVGTIPYTLIKPMLETVDPETLDILETASPHLVHDTSELWKRFCFRLFPTAAGDVERENPSTSVDWKDHYLDMRAQQAQRLEEVAAKLRNQRQAAEKQKKEDAIKVTDRLPPAKRPRWGMPAPQKTLFQKTRDEVQRRARSTFGSKSTMQTARIVPNNVNAKVSLLPNRAQASSAGERTNATFVTVTKRPCKPSNPKPAQSAPSTQPAFSTPPQPPPSSISQQTAKPVGSRPIKSLPAGKKDLASTLFMPKNRAYSQLNRTITGGNR